MSVRADVYIHASSRSLVETEEIGAGTKIWSNVRVLAGARIGRECVIGTNVFIDADVVGGDRVKIQNGVSLYRGVVAEDGVFFGPHCTTTNDLDPAAITPEGKLKGPEDWTLGRTLFREGARVGAHTLVTHDVPDFALVTGVPGHVARYVCPRGLRHRVELVGSVPRCGECGRELRSIVSRR